MRKEGEKKEREKKNVFDIFLSTGSACDGSNGGRCPSIVGAIEVDECAIGGERGRKHVRNALERELVVGALGGEGDEAYHVQGGSERAI